MSLRTRARHDAPTDRAPMYVANPSRRQAERFLLGDHDTKANTAAMEVFLSATNLAWLSEMTGADADGDGDGRRALARYVARLATANEGMKDSLRTVAKLNRHVIEGGFAAWLADGDTAVNPEGRSRLPDAHSGRDATAATRVRRFNATRDAAADVAGMHPKLRAGVERRSRARAVTRHVQPPNFGLR